MVASEFEALRQLLADQEKHITHRLENMQKTVMQKHKDRISQLNAQLSSTQKTIHDLENNAGAFCQVRNVWYSDVFLIQCFLIVCLSTRCRKSRAPFCT